MSLHVRAWACSLQSFPHHNYGTEGSWTSWQQKLTASFVVDFICPQKNVEIIVKLSPHAHFPTSIVRLLRCAARVSWFEPWGWTFHWNLRAETHAMFYLLLILHCTCSWLVILLESCIIRSQTADLRRIWVKFKTAVVHSLHVTKIFSIMICWADIDLHILDMWDSYLEPQAF